MKYWSLSSSLLYVILLVSGCGEKNEFPVLKGPYLGQSPPGMTPELFAPGIVSTENHDAIYGFLANGTACIFDHSSSKDANPSYTAYFSWIADGRWTPPVVTNFHKTPSERKISLVPDSYSLLYGSPQAAAAVGKSARGFNLWIIKLTTSGLSQPRMFDSPLNSDQNDIYPSFTEDGTIYFFSSRDGDNDIYRAELKAGRYATVERLGNAINTEHDELDPFIAPDESYLVYCSKTLDGFGGYDLYVTFRSSDGSWTTPVNMGSEINSAEYDWMPHVSPDGKYFFFNSRKSGNGDVYWVDAKIIETLRPKDGD